MVHGAAAEYVTSTNNYTDIKVSERSNGGKGKVVVDEGTTGSRWTCLVLRLGTKCAARTTRLVVSGSVVAITFVKFYAIWCRVHESARFCVSIELAEGVETM
jgi:hypothetical protein